MKKISKNIIFYIITIVAATLSSCSDSLFEDGGQNDGANIRLAADIEQLSVMRVNDSGFCDGDMMGVYVVDYEGGKPGTLKPSGNRGDNVRYTFDESANKWTGAYDLYWKDKHTPIDVYGYYPFAAPESIDDYQFEVQKDQSKPSADGEMGGY
ncbi:MAG: fimbrillin family protein, partial [Prevotella pectinovora]